MFIYRFSRLIKSRLLWILLALLMVFAFVVADSCSGVGGQGGLLRGGEEIAPQTFTQAERTVGALTNEAMFSMTPDGRFASLLPHGADAFAGALMASEPQASLSTRSGRLQQRMVWKILAARQLADRYDLTRGGDAAAKQLIEASYADGQGAFVPELYLQFLGRANFARTPREFERLYAQTWLPAQAAAAAVRKSVGWVSPMERDFLLAAAFDETTACAVTLKNTAKPEDMAVSDEEAQAWYDANQERYRRPEERTIAYVEIPSQTFLRTGDPSEEEELEAMQYHASHMDEFKSKTSTNATDVVTYEEVRDEVLAKVRELAALEEARVFASEKLVPQLDAKPFAEVAKHYESKTATIPEGGWPVGFQNAIAVRDTVFTLEPEGALSHDVVPGTDRVYLIQLTDVRESAIKPLDEVKDQILTAVRADKVRKQSLERGEAVRAQLAKSLAEGKSLKDAVAACKDANLSAGEAQTFTLADPSSFQQQDATYRTQILGAARSLGQGALSEPSLVGNNDVLLIYVASRVERNPVDKATQGPLLVRQMAENTAFQTAGDWLSWAIDTVPLTRPDGTPLLQAEEE